MRQSRKLQHLQYSTELPDGPRDSCFSDIALIHNCLPNLSCSDIKLSSDMMGIKLTHPVIINAITGGSPDVKKINRQIAEFARLTNSIMAVGSQYAALENPEVCDSYTIVNKVNPHGIIWANLGAYASPDDAVRAIDMINAQAIQIHLNVAQELVMAEGDRSFSGYLSNIEKIVDKVHVPVIVKEVGCGIAKEQALALAGVGVQAIDIGGAGGTNFIAIEAVRSSTEVNYDLLHWGIPTAISTIEVAAVLPSTIKIIVSGGIRSSLDIVKAIALGGSAVAIAAPIIRYIYEQGVEQTAEWFIQLLDQVKKYMLLIGTKDINELQNVPFVITGYSRDWLSARGIDITRYATPQKQA